MFGPFHPIQKDRKMGDSGGVGISEFNLVKGLEKHVGNFQEAGRLFRLDGDAVVSPPPHPIFGGITRQDLADSFWLDT